MRSAVGTVQIPCIESQTDRAAVQWPLAAMTDQQRERWPGLIEVDADLCGPIGANALVLGARARTMKAAMAETTVGVVIVVSHEGWEEDGPWQTRGCHRSVGRAGSGVATGTAPVGTTAAVCCSCCTTATAPRSCSTLAVICCC